MLKTRPERVLITGGAGFLGSHLCRHYLAKGYDVLCLDNLYTGDKANIAELITEPRFEFIRHDITKPIDLEVDLILNFACPASPPHYQKLPIKTMETSVIGTLNMLKLAQATGARFVMASTSEVYGDPLQHPQPESYWGNVNPHGIRSCYDEGKRAAEALCFDFHRHYGQDIRVVRIFNTYGPNMDSNDGRAVSNFIVQALTGKDITIYGDGSYTRSFCYASDLIRGITDFTAQNDHIGPVNLGNDREFTIKELAETIISLTGSSSKLSYLPTPKDDPKVRRPDLTLAKKLIGFENRVPLEDGLKLTIPYFQKLLDR